MRYELTEAWIRCRISYIAHHHSPTIHLLILGILWSTIPLITTYPSESWPSQADPSIHSIDVEWGGHVRGRGNVSWPDDKAAPGVVDTGPYYDGSGECRLKNQVFFGNWGNFETHYEAILSGGDTRCAEASLARLHPAWFSGPSGPPDDDLRIMHLTGVLEQEDDFIFYHRLDRLCLTLQPAWGTVRIGRQVVTWGNGLVFNPMDLFNPFAPTDVERDYKAGDDMLSAQFRVRQMGEFQFLHVPRRDPASHDVAWNESSIAGKWHFALGTTEFDLMGARHYKDYVVGLGSMGYLGNAAWRMDTTWTLLNEDSDEEGFLSVVANLDYSWAWWGKNLYGLIEFYFNGLGEDRYSDVFTNEDIIKRVERGEIHTLGRSYLAGEVQVELHPLFRAYFTAIDNLADPSGILQPRAVWDVAQNVQMTLGANVYYGATGTEYGGFRISGTDVLNKPSNSVFLWLSYFF